MFRKIFIALLLVIVVVIGGGYLYLHSSLQEVDGTVKVTGLDGEVEILRDRYGIPHITGKSYKDAMFGLGYAQVQDRLWQMEMNRRIGAGRLSEIFGEKALGTDKFLRALDVYGHSERTFANLSKEGQENLTAYVNGVNSALENWSGSLPLEFVILGIKPEPWKPADSLVWIKMMAWDLGDNWEKEIFRLQLLQRLTPKQVSQIMPPYPGEKAVPLPELKTLFADFKMDLDKLVAMAPEILPDGAGSNNWVLSGERSETGKPLLANDPHLGLAAPALWYYAHIKAPGVDAIGSTLPGVPGIILGRNLHIAWGFTNTAPDTQDLFIEKSVPGKPGFYLTPDGPKPFNTRDIVIKVKDSDPVKMTLRSSRHGPIISDILTSTKDVFPEGYSLAFAWTTLRDDDLSAQAANNLMKAKNWEEFKTALQDFHSPEQNIVFADTKGNIGYFAPGRVPIRKPENKIQGVMPVPGWDATYDWNGFIPYDELPQIYNPANGTIQTANQKIVDDSYPHFITHDWTLPYRANRIDQLLGAREKHSVSSFKALQADTKSLMAEELLPLMINSLSEAEKKTDTIKLLSAWDFNMVVDKAEPLIFTAWFREMTRNIYGDELGTLLTKNWKHRPQFIRNVLTDKEGQSQWCDDIKTNNKETCQTQVSNALKTALNDLEKRYGSKEKWKWGTAHFAHSDHRPFTNVGGLREIFDIKVPSVGGTYTVNVGRMKFANEEYPFANQHAASLRAIYDLSNLDNSQFIFSTGQSGSPLSPLYDSMAMSWSRMEYLPLTTKKEEYEKGSIGRLILKP
ncbi:MAG: penicillin acylase family protein [Rhodospirillales bacterium]|nr:penicillin acylase family protein [Rhodospirillales bacterium]